MQEVSKIYSSEMSVTLSSFLRILIGLLLFEFSNSGFSSAAVAEPEMIPRLVEFELRKGV